MYAKLIRVTFLDHTGRYESILSVIAEARPALILLQNLEVLRWNGSVHEGDITYGSLFMHANVR